MLLRFRCKNFRSIREEQEISLIAAKTRTDERSESLIDTPFDDLKLLRCAAIYGPNASGKSNVLDALATFRRIVSGSWRAWKPDGAIPEFDPFVLDETSREGRTTFELTFLLDSRIYRYGFSYDRREFSNEVLVDATGRNDRILFRRPNGSEVAAFPGGNLWSSAFEKRTIEDIGREVRGRPNSLFLSAAAQRAFPLLLGIYSRLTRDFRAMHWKNLTERQRYTAEMCSQKGFCDKIQALLGFADAGIAGIEASRRDLPEDEKKAINAMMKALRESDPERYASASMESPEFPQIPEVRMVHSGADGRGYALDESKESDGTQAYFAALGPVLRALERGEVLLIDELESSLHPKLSRELVRIFNSSELNPKGAQFIFTTHNSNLLDLGLLRRDQVWFAEKSREGSTRLYPLTDFQPRMNQNIELGYLGGRFGATPYLDEQLLSDALIPSEPAQASLEFSGEK
ncbi:MAG: AAA family ATPase [Terracidiphilus sp.]